MSQRISAVRACLHGVGAPQLLEVTRFGEVTGLPVPAPACAYNPSFSGESGRGLTAKTSRFFGMAGS